MYSSRCKNLLATLLVSLLLQACAEPQDPPAVQADQVFRNGTVITIDESMPRVAAVAVKDGKILARGSEQQIDDLIGPDTEVIDLQGQALLPGFVDGHSHFSHAVTMADWVNVSPPPVGPVSNIADLVATLQKAAEEKGLQKGEPLFAYGYDENALEEVRHITKLDLDPHYPDNPVFLMHISGHGAVLNSSALAQVGITEETSTPEGGVIVRLPDSNDPAGLLMETAWIPVVLALFSTGTEGFAAGIQAAQQLYASNGYTTVQDGATGYDAVLAYLAAAEQDAFYLDLVALPVFADLENILADDSLVFGRYQNRLKLAGIKFLADGSPQGKTAFFTEPLLTGGPGGEEDWRGEPILPFEAYESMFMQVHERGWRSYTHGNGDAAIDFAIQAHRKAGITAADDLRNVVIHSQFVRPDQLDSYVELGISPSFFSNHAFFWGDVHWENLGEERASFLSPLNAAAKKGIRYSNHTDYIVTPLDPMFLVWTAVNRTSRSGRVIGPDERVSPLQAIKAMTLDAAWQYKEEDSKGSIEVGKLADLVVLSASPLDVAPNEIRDIQVKATYKEGRQVF
jgi:predicted amidohydrolase YtcJ